MNCCKRLIFSAVLACTCSHTFSQVAANTKEAHNGALRVALVFAPVKSTFFVSKNENGSASGVTADLAQAYGVSLGVPINDVLYPNSGAAADALERGDIDFSFMPVDASRRQRFDFGPSYTDMQSTFLVTAASGVKSLSDLDRDDRLVIAIANTSTHRSAVAMLKHAKVTAVATIVEAIAALRQGEADALALTRDALPSYVAEVPGSMVLAEDFQKTGIAIAVRKGDVEGLRSVSRFMEKAKIDGTVREALDHAGYATQMVAR